jgi:carbamate kinase
VIDKDLASAVLAHEIGADLFVISTAVDKVCLNFGRPDQRALDSLTVAEARRYLAEGHFAPGSMRPKIEAAIRFLEGGGGEALITGADTLDHVFDGHTGTRIVP